MNTLLAGTSACASETCAERPPAGGTNPPAWNVRLERGNAGKHPGIHLVDSGLSGIIAVSSGAHAERRSPHGGILNPGGTFFNVLM